MTTYNFDAPVDRRATDSVKWNLFDADVLPMWVADMDFPAPEPVLRALHRRVDEGFFGYGDAGDLLRPVIVERMARLYGWQVDPAAIVYVPNLVNGLFLSSQAVGAPGDGLLMQMPVYGPFLMTAEKTDKALQGAELTAIAEGSTLRYEIDFDAYEAAITDRTSLFLMSNPHNPVGRVFTRAELERMAEICLRHNLIICSDEIHSDLLYDGRAHIPIAALSPEVATRTITLHSTSKTFNLPGLGLGYAIIEDAALRQRFKDAYSRMGIHISLLGFWATLAAYQEADDWLRALLGYLQGNRDFVVDYVAQHMPGVRVTRPEGTYLSWLDCREAGIGEKVGDFFLNEARVAVNDGAWFGKGGTGFARLNYACPRAQLETALGRMAEALSRAAR